ncbi:MULTISPECIES: YcxB family protein [unclassified Acidovorax]|uniref:YcxB family protein n=1 Tax=unclassified Acidovorax TaxID=2684926 RepID=UPI001C465654|nr:MULTISPECIES: YcxB family protein [unclassified Acidovorax]MBV7460447.1 YcxB family protein [Acidovorax sp. sif0632]MBV7465472.1 YcxB family protein [Acidovorax sp. sif0613]
MRIQFKTTYWDVLWFSITHAFRSPWYQLTHGLFAAWIIWTFMTDSKADFMTAFLIALFWWVAIWLSVFFVLAFAAAGKRNKTMFVEHTIEISDEGLLEETKFNKSIFYWPGIVKLLQRPGFIAVYISGHQAHVIPKRFFASKAEMDEFRRLLEHHVQTAKSSV